MLTIQFGVDENTMKNPKGNFNALYKKEWMNDDFVRQMIRAVDKTEAIKDNYLESPILGAISPKQLSGGVKTLIMMYKTDYTVNATYCGNNCAEWIIKISKMKDLKIVLEYLMDFPRDEEAFIVNENKVCKLGNPYYDAYYHWMKKEGYV